MSDERRYLLSKSYKSGLSTFESIICFVDLFGVLPIIVLPGALIRCGYFGAFMLTFIVVGVQIFTAILLSKSWQMAEVFFGENVCNNRCPYATLAYITYGRFSSKFVTFLLDLSIFASGIPNLIIASQNLEIFLNFALNSNISFCYGMVIMGFILCPIFWLGSPKDMKLICLTSVINLLTIVILVNVTILSDNRFFDNTVIMKNNVNYFETLISTYGLMVFQLDIHPSLLTIQVDMNDATKSGRVIALGFVVSIVLIAFTTITAAITYGTDTSGSILSSLPFGTPLYIVLFLVTLQLSLSSTLSQNAFFQHIEDYFNISREFNQKRCLLRSSLVIVSILVAELIPRFDIIMGLIGGTLTGPLIFLFPPLFYLRLTRMSCNQGLKLNPIVLILIGLCLTFGSILTIVSTLYNFINAIDYVRIETPCLINISQDLSKMFN